jgi:single-strand DNA-binding protein
VEQYVKKGDKLYIEGRLRTRQWDDKDGNKRYTTEIYADNMEMLGGARNAENSNQQATQHVSAPASHPDESDFEASEEDDLPF